MAQKNATPTREQAQIIEKNGLKSTCWVVVKEMPHSMLVKHRITGEFRMINK